MKEWLVILLLLLIRGAGEGISDYKLQVDLKRVLKNIKTIAG